MFSHKNHIERFRKCNQKRACSNATGKNVYPEAQRNVLITLLTKKAHVYLKLLHEFHLLHRRASGKRKHAWLGVHPDNLCRNVPRFVPAHGIVHLVIV